MKHWKRILAAALSVTLLCGVCFAVSGISAPRANAANEDTVSPQPEASFTDVPAEAWYAEAVGWCRENGIMSGTSATTFAPESSMTRAMMVTVLHRAAGTPASTGENVFTDNLPGSWSYDAVLWASANHVLAGYGDGRFGNGDPVTKEQAAVILYRYAGNPDAGTALTAADASLVSSYAVNAVAWASANGLLRADDTGRIHPKTNAARAEVAYMLYQHLCNSDVPSSAPSGDTPQVFMTADISPEGLMAIYKALNWTPTGNVAVKLSTGEPPASNYLDPALIADVVHEVNGTIVECNTAYGGSRANTAMHYQVAEDHGFTAIADVVIMDENGSMTLPVIGGTRLTENYVGAHFADYDSFLVLSHFKGHAMAGYGGAIKNISIGIASSEGKGHIHSGGTGGSMWGADQNAFLEAMGEAGKSVVDALDGQIVYINVMNRLSVDCDCDGNPAEPDMHDIGILASCDPVALDQACVDLVYAAEDGASLIQRIESRNGIHTIEHAAEIGLGSREYTLVNID